jgi:hypothetical protein
MAKSNWLKHVTTTYKMLKQSNPEAKLKDAMRIASKTFKKVSSIVRDYVPKKGKKTFRKMKGKRGSRRLRRSRRYRGGEGEEENKLLESESA